MVPIQTIVKLGKLDTFKFLTHLAQSAVYHFQTIYQGVHKCILSYKVCFNKPGFELLVVGRNKIR